MGRRRGLSPGRSNPGLQLAMVEQRVKSGVHDISFRQPGKGNPQKTKVRGQVDFAIQFTYCSFFPFLGGVGMFVCTWSTFYSVC